AAEQWSGLLLDDAGLDIGKCGKLGRQGQPCRSATDDQNIDFPWKRSGCSGGQISLRGIRNPGVARLESVQMKLHETRSFPSPTARTAVASISGADFAKDLPSCASTASLAHRRTFDID